MNNQLVPVKSYQADGESGGKGEKKREEGCQLTEGRDGGKRPMAGGDLGKGGGAGNQHKKKV